MIAHVRLCTIGFTQKSAERFFGLLRQSGIARLIDTRLKPGGHLAGFANGRDLPFFLDRLADGCRYEHLPRLAPTPEMLGDYRKDHDWNRYVARYETLMDERGVPAALDRAEFARWPTCLLCSEATPDACHRRLVAERLARAWGDVEIIHLV
ncbi:MAG: DUF488 domain-containing protein [Thermomicrobiales bacterium]|nr:DUF488 domain-containing protein [Thermomicrobiales bacterium]